MLNAILSKLRAMPMGSRIQEARKSVKLSQEALGAKVGVTKSAISQWESDLTVPTAENVLSVSDATGYSYRWLIRGEPPKKYERTEQFFEFLHVCSLDEIKQILRAASDRLSADNQ